MAKVATVSVDFRANTATFQRNLRTASNAVNSSQARMNRATALMQRSFAGVQRSVTNLTGGLGGLRGALAAVLGGAGLAALVRQALQAADSIADTSDRLGIAVESLQELRFAAEQAGVATNTFDMALQRFTRRSAEAANGTGAAKDALEQMGIALRDSSGNLRASEDMLADVADALREVEDPAERVRLAFQLFDSEGVAMVNMLSSGSAELEQMRRRARDLGLVMDESLIRRTADFSAELSTVSQIIRTNFQSGLLQGLIGDGEKLSDVFADGELAGAIEDIAATLGNLGRVGMDVLPVMARNFELVTIAASALLGLRFGPWGALVGAAAAAVAVLNTNSTALRDSTRELDGALQTHEQWLRAIERGALDAAAGYRTMAIEQARAARQQAVAGLEELNPRVSRAMSAYREFQRRTEDIPVLFDVDDVVGRAEVELNDLLDEQEAFNRALLNADRLLHDLNRPIETVRRSLEDARQGAEGIPPVIDGMGGGADDAAGSVEDLAGAFIRAGNEAARMEYELAQLHNQYSELLQGLRDAQSEAFAAGDLEESRRLAGELENLTQSFLTQEEAIRERYAPAVEVARGGIRALRQEAVEATEEMESVADQVANLFQRQSIRAFEASARAGFAGLEGDELRDAEVRLRAITDLARQNLGFLTATGGELAEIRDLYVEQELAIARVSQVQENQLDLSADFASIMGQGLKGIITGTDSWQDALRGVLDRLFDIVAELMVIQPLVQALGGGGGGGIFGSLLGGVAGGLGGGLTPWQISGFGGLFADGGRPPVGRVSIVGERGPELFVPDAAGTIIPHHEIGGPAGGDTVNVSLNFALGVQGTVRAEVSNMLPQITEAVSGAVANRASRGGRYAARLRGG